MRISHDKESGALYIRLREGRYDHTEDLSERADVYVDVDADGNVLGVEALSFEDLAMAIEERGGKLDVPGSSATSTQSVAHSAAQEASAAAESAAQQAASIADEIIDVREYTLEYDEDETHSEGRKRSRRSR